MPTCWEIKNYPITILLIYYLLVYYHNPLHIHPVSCGNMWFYLDQVPKDLKSFWQELHISSEQSNLSLIATYCEALHK